MPPIDVVGIVGAAATLPAGSSLAGRTRSRHDDDDSRALRLPLFDEDLEVDGPPAEVEAQQAAVRAADALIIATPEYNFGVPGPVKNWLDWMSRPPRKGPLVGKPVLLAGVSTGRTGGTVQAQGQLRISLAVVGAHVVAHPPVLVAEAADRFDGPDVTDEMTATVSDLALRRLAELTTAMGAPLIAFHRPRRPALGARSLAHDGSADGR